MFVHRGHLILRFCSIRAVIFTLHIQKLFAMVLISDSFSVLLVCCWVRLVFFHSDDVNCNLDCETFLLLSLLVIKFHEASVKFSKRERETCECGLEQNKESINSYYIWDLFKNVKRNLFYYCRIEMRRIKSYSLIASFIGVCN
jgi:hypothetical protein